MPVYRGPDLSAEDVEAKVRAASAALAECKTIPELRQVWRDYFLVCGHRVLGRLFMAECKNVDKVAEKRAMLAK